MESNRASISPLLNTAQQRSLGMRLGRTRRIEARKRRLDGMKKFPLASSQDASDFERKTRALISAIRCHTNTDVPMDVHMSPDKLFEIAVKVLALHASAVRNESKLVGETLDVISRLNKVLQKW